MIVKIPREDSVNSLLNCYIKLNFEVIERTDNSQYADGNDIRLVNLGPIFLFRSFKSTTSSEEYLADIRHAHTVSLMQKLLTSAKCFDDLPMSLIEMEIEGETS